MTEVATQTAPEREGIILLAVKRLGELADDSQELVERLDSTFSDVIIQRTDTTAPREGRPPEGSRLAEELMRHANKIDESFMAIRRILESTDL